MSLLKNMSLVVISPAAGWDDIDKSGYPASTVLSGLYYPLLALMSVSCFCAMLYDHTLTLSMSVMRAVIAFVSYFIAYYTVVFLIDCLFPRQTQGKVAKARCCNYVAYILSFLVILETPANELFQNLCLRDCLQGARLCEGGQGIAHQISAGVRHAAYSSAHSAVEDSWRSNSSQQLTHKTMAKNSNKTNVNIKNRRATFDYEIISTYTAGMVLTGTEIKSLRLGKAGLTDTYCITQNREVWLKNMYIAEYSYGSYNNHYTHRDRKLLLNKKEIADIEKAAAQPGYSVVPLRVFINERGLAKIVIAVARGKKQFDKRQSIKERDDKRDMQRAMKR